VKNRNNDWNDASLQVNHLSDVHGSRSKGPSSHEVVTKMYTYHPNRAPWLETKTQEFVLYYEKVTMQLILSITSSAGFFFSFFITFADFQDNTYLVRVA
jgi:hypothetical protein